MVLEKWCYSCEDTWLCTLISYTVSDKYSVCNGRLEMENFDSL